ncbi:MAG: hypothetical protein ACREQC_02895, partial [Candidatus Binataceae bacterium]
VEVILFGDDEGAAEASRELGICHEPEIRKAEHGTKYLNYLFGRAQQIARHNIVCYVNCDIILTSGFRKGIEIAASLGRPFLMVGHRWDINITEPWDFSQSDWEERLMSVVSQRGKQQTDWYIDYFAFTRGLYQEIPPLVIGRVRWDNWLVWRARSLGAKVIQASPLVKAIHQNHDYAYHPAGAAGVWSDDLAQRNYALAGGEDHMNTIQDAPYEFRGLRVRHKPDRYSRAIRAVRLRIRQTWFALLNVTRGFRHALGLRHKNISTLRAKLGSERGQNRPE